MKTVRDKVNITIAILLGLTIFMIPYLLLGIITRKQATKKHRRPWLWYWLGVTFPLVTILVLVWLGDPSDDTAVPVTA